MSEFVIDDLSKAEWALKKIAASRKEISSKTAQAEKMKQDIDKWLEEEIKTHTDDVVKFEILLMPFVNSQIEGTKKKSLKLPSGKVGFRAGSNKFLIGGIEASSKNESLISFAEKSMPEFIEQTRTAKWGEIKKLLTVTDEGVVITTDGEIVPDMKVEQGEPKFYTEVKDL